MDYPTREPCYGGDPSMKVPDPIQNGVDTRQQTGSEPDEFGFVRVDAGTPFGGLVVTFTIVALLVGYWAGAFA